MGPEDRYCGVGPKTATEIRPSRYESAMKAYGNVMDSIVELETLCDRITGPEAGGSEETMKSTPDPQNVAFLLNSLPSKLIAIKERIDCVYKRFDNALM